MKKPLQRKRSIALAQASHQTRARKPRTAGPRTKMGRKGVKIKDLALVADPRDSGQEFLAEVIGGYEHGDTWYLQLGPVPGRAGKRGAPPPRPPRQSTKAAYVKQLYRRGGKA